MYEYISGRVAEITPTYAVIDVGGVGYYLQISLETYSAVERAEQALLYTHYIVREDAQLLYGFATKGERELFRHLISVSGVGGNTARMVLSTYSPRELQGIITSGNAVLLKNVKGLGLKTAQKISVELSGKLMTLGSGDVSAMANVSGGAFDEAAAALVMLGFSKPAVDKALRTVLRENSGAAEFSAEELVRMGLKKM
jgi:Holliday junction DNA helicase RuvA